MKKKQTFWRQLDKKTKIASRLALRFALLVGVLFIIYALISGFLRKDPIIQPFEVPQTWEAAGLDGGIVAKYVVDKLNFIKATVNSQKADSTFITNTEKIDLNVNVMGVGLSLNSLSYYFQNMFGRNPETISGEILEVGNKIKMTLRMTGYPNQEYSIDISANNRLEAMDETILSAAQGILTNTDPYRVAVYQYKTGNLEKSLQIVKTMINRGDRDLEWAYLAWANVLKEQKDLNGYESKLKKALSINPNFTLALRNLGWNSVAVRRYNKGIEYFQKAYEIDSNNFDNIHALAQCNRFIGDFNRAEYLYKRAIQERPDISWAYGNYASMKIYEIGDTLEGIEILRKGRKQATDQKSIYQGMSFAYLAEGKFDSAKYMLNQVLDLDYSDMHAHAGIIRFYFNSKDYENTIDAVKAMVGNIDTVNGDGNYLTLQAYNYASMACYNLEEFERSIAFAKKAIAKLPNDPMAYTSLAEAYGFWGKKELFYETFEKALELGFDVNRLMGDEPYMSFANERRFQDIVRKYKLKG